MTADAWWIQWVTIKISSVLGKCRYIRWVKVILKKNIRSAFLLFMMKFLIRAKLVYLNAAIDLRRSHQISRLAHLGLFLLILLLTLTLLLRRCAKASGSSCLDVKMLSPHSELSKFYRGRWELILVGNIQMSLIHRRWVVIIHKLILIKLR